MRLLPRNVKGSWGAHRMELHSCFVVGSWELSRVPGCRRREPNASRGRDLLRAFRTFRTCDRSVQGRLAKGRNRFGEPQSPSGLIRFVYFRAWNRTHSGLVHVCGHVACGRKSCDSLFGFSTFPDPTWVAAALEDSPHGRTRKGGKESPGSSVSGRTAVPAGRSR